MRASMSVRQTIESSFTTAAAVLVIAALYVVIVHYFARVPWREAWKRTGLVLGDPKGWLLSFALLIPWLAYVALSFRLMPVTAADTTSPYHALLGRGLSGEVVGAALTYGIVSAGLGEELLFRGLIGGALGRRMTPWRANAAQTLIFLAPHLLILLVKPEAIVLLPIGVGGLGALTGWLRLRSGSIGPGVVLHGLGNAFVGVLAATGPG